MEQKQEYKHLLPYKASLVIDYTNFSFNLIYDIKNSVVDFKEEYINTNWNKTKSDSLSGLLKDEESEIEVKINTALNERLDSEENVELRKLCAEIMLSNIKEEDIPKYITAITERLDKLLDLSIPQAIPPKYEELYNHVRELGFKNIEITDE